jgi:DUF1365 family protein
VVQGLRERSLADERAPHDTRRGPRMKPAQALLARGEVRHRRLRPSEHAFAYPTYFLMLPMRSLRQHALRGAAPQPLRAAEFSRP